MISEIFNEQSERSRTECFELVKYRDRAQLMTFIMRDDTRHSFDYDSLYGAHYLGHLIRVEFSRNTVLVTGKHLALLHRAMTDHRVVYLREKPVDFQEREGEPVVKKIRILEKLSEGKPEQEEKSNHENQRRKQE